MMTRTVPDIEWRHGYMERWIILMLCVMCMSSDVYDPVMVSQVSVW